MPFTPLHFGPALMIGMLFFSYLDFPTFMVASIALDIEPAIAVIFQLSYPWYGWFHHPEGSIVAVIVVAAVMYALKSYASKVLGVFRLQQESSFKKILLASLVGVYFHLLLDAPLHTQLELNMVPVGLTSTELVIYAFCLLSLIIGLILYKRRINHKEARETDSRK